MIPLVKSAFFKERATRKKLAQFIASTEKFSFGTECEKFEQRFATWQERNDCILLNSGSSANIGLIQALLNLGYLKPGDNVGFSSITWSTNVMPLFQLGLEPIPVDVAVDTLNVSSENLLETLKRYKLRALFLTNLLGLCGDLDEIVSLCNKHNILLIEDNCESLGTVYQGKKLGNFGIASTSSFYVGHHLSTIEGGAVCTDDPELAQMVRIVRAHGWDRNLSSGSKTAIRKKYKLNSEFYSRYAFYDLGYNLRPTEITGFLGNLQLEYLDMMVAKREKNFKYLYANIHGKTDTLHPISYAHLDVFSSFSYPLVFKTSKDRDTYVKQCADTIEVRPIVGGNIVSQPFFSKYSNKSFKRLTKHAHMIHEQGLYMPNNPELTKEDLNTLVAYFK